MLPASGPMNHSGNSVTTLIVSTSLFLDRDELVPPLLDRRARRDALERQQPLAVVRPPARQHQRPRQHGALFAQHVDARLRREHRARILDEGKHRDFPLLAVRLAQPPDYAGGGRLPSTPAFLRSERTVSVGIAPFSSQARACSTFTSITAGLARGL